MFFQIDRSKVLPDEYIAKATAYWTPEKLKKLTAGKSYFLTPLNAALLLHELGILNKDCSMSHDSMRKFIQINHMLNLLETQLKNLCERFNPVRILDAGCGKSYLTFLLAWYFKEIAKHPCEIIGVDSNKKIIDGCKKRAIDLGYASIQFHALSLAELNWRELIKSEDPRMRPHAVFALHACDTATDHAMAIAIKEKSDFFAVAPCCQVELARYWKENLESLQSHPLHPVFSTPQIRREIASDFTDMLRVLLTRAHGYEVTATEFVPSEHTPKNRLITALRRGNYLESAQQEYTSLKKEIGDCSITLESILVKNVAPL